MIDLRPEGRGAPCEGERLRALAGGGGAADTPSAKAEGRYGIAMS
jgi:hypothetical protein